MKATKGTNVQRGEHFCKALYMCVFGSQEEVAKNLLAEFNLGCDAHRTEHVYRVYVSTFLGFGGNAARQRYEENLMRKTITRNK